MKIEMRLIILTCGLILAGIIFYFHSRNKIKGYNFLIWLVSSMFVILFSLAPNIINLILRLIGVKYPPILLLLFSVLIIAFMFLHHSLQITMLDNQLRELSQYSPGGRPRQKNAVKKHMLS